MTNEPTTNDNPDKLPENSETNTPNTDQQGNDDAPATPTGDQSKQEADSAAEADTAAEENAAPDTPAPADEEAASAPEAAPEAAAAPASDTTPETEATPEAETAPEARTTSETGSSASGNDMSDQEGETPASPESTAPEDVTPEEAKPEAEVPQMVTTETESPKEEPKAEEPKAEEPKAEEPKAEEPKAEEPKAEEPKAEEPKAEEPKAEAATQETAAAGDEGDEDKNAADEAAAPTAPKKKKLSDEEAQPIWDELKAAFDNNELLTFTLNRSIPGGAIVSYKGLEGFVPRSQFLISGRADQSEIESHVGQEIDLIVIEMTDFSKRKFVCSRKRALKKQRMMELKKGSIVEGKVTSITSYGAFVNLGGVDGLIHISRLSKIRVNTPNEVVSLGETVKVRIVDINEKDERIALSMKEFTESPWTHAEEHFPVGTTVKGKVRNITDFGVYVQLEPGIVGMVHISDLSWTQRIQHPTEVVKIGEEIEVKVMDVRPKDRRIALSLKDTQPDPWSRLANIYPPNTEADGTVKQLMQAGAIVSLDFDMDCFVPRGKMGRHRRGQPAPSYEVGDKVRIRVVEMDVEKHSFIGAIVREDGGDDEPQGRESRQDFRMPRQSESDGGFKLGDLEGLQQLLNSTAKADESEPATSTEEPPAPDEAKAAETPQAEESTPVTPPAEESPAVEPPSTDEPSKEEPAAQRPVGEATGDLASTEDLKTQEETPASDAAEEKEKQSEAPGDSISADAASESAPDTTAEDNDSEDTSDSTDEQDEEKKDDSSSVG